MEAIVIISVLNLILDIGIVIFMLFVLAPILRGAPYVPTHQERIEKAFSMIVLQPEQKIVDLGSGDGRILLAAAARGAKAYGLEINPFLAVRAQQAARKKGLADKVFSCWANFWWKDLSDYDVVFVYGIPYIMKGLAKKLQRELKPGARVVAFVFPLPNWQPIAQEKSVYVYEKSIS
ncbi:MAG: class I SAM-dependent methyltransferase [Candidatus Pacebacteria bacterium]|nr:class I SAM-dependent methyltransferase [Candidatus Paceibacterota bacterium]